MSAPRTLVIQTQHVTTHLDPSSVLVIKDLLEMVVTAQVWNANVSMEGNLPTYLFPITFLLFTSPATTISTHSPVLLYSQFPTFKPTSTSLTPILIFTTTPNYILLLVLLLLLFGTQIVISVQYFLPHNNFLYLGNWDFSLAKEYLYIFLNFNFRCWWVLQQPLSFKCNM